MNKTPDVAKDQASQPDPIEQSNNESPKVTPISYTPAPNPLPWLIRNLCNKQSLQSGAGDRPVAR